MRKKFLWLIALMAAFTLVAAACGSDDDGTETDAGTESDESTDEADEGESDETTDSSEADEGEMEEGDDETDEGADSGDEGASGDLPTGGITGDCASEDVLCVGVVTDVGKIDDKSFNQSAWLGAGEVQSSLGAEIDYIETQDSTDYATNIASFLDQEVDVVITVGFALADATIEAATANPETHFIGVDQFQGEPLDNLTGLIFPEDQSGFLAGALAGHLTETNTVAQVLGTDLVPPVVAFKEGFDAGVAHTNPDAEVISTYHPGGLDVAFTDPTWGADTARQALDNGADVVFGAGGLTGNGALGEVAKENGEAFCIGVDTDQWETVPEAQPCLVTSAMKLITPGVVDIVTAYTNGEVEGGNFVGEVGLAPYHDFESVVPAEVQAEIEELTDQVLSGEVTTGYTP